MIIIIIIHRNKSTKSLVNPRVEFSCYSRCSNGDFFAVSPHALSTVNVIIVTVCARRRPFFQEGTVKMRLRQMNKKQHDDF